MSSSTREALRRAALDLFAEKGYDDTSVDEIAARAGVGRTTFFRLFGSKEHVVFPDHEVVLARVDERLSAASRETMRVAVVEAARIVLRSYLADPELARTRYRLTRTVDTLRDRELASTRQYRLLFHRHLRGWLRDDPDGDLRAELLAGAVVTAHNFVLRGWLRGQVPDPEAEFDHAMQVATRAGTTATAAAGASAGTDGNAAGSTVVVLRADLPPDAAAEAVRAALDGR